MYIYRQRVPKLSDMISIPYSILYALIQFKLNNLKICCCPQCHHATFSYTIVSVLFEKHLFDIAVNIFLVKLIRGMIMIFILSLVRKLRSKIIKKS